MPKQLLSDAFLRGVKPSDKIVEYWDARVPGLCLRVMPSGVRSWGFRYRPQGSTSFKRLPVGHYPEVGLALARERAEAQRVAVSGGADPQGAKEEAKAASSRALSFNDLADAYLERYAKVHKKSWRQDELLLDAHVRPVWGARKGDSIRRGDAAELLDAIARTAPTSANRTHSILSKVFNFAVDSELAVANPLASMKKRAKETPKDRVLSPAEIRLLWRKIETSSMEAGIAVALRVLLLVGARPGEVAGAEISELKEASIPNRARLEIPGARMKGGRPHIVPLTPLALDLIRSCAVEGQTHVFPSNFEARGPVARHSLSQALGRLIRGLDEQEDEAAATLKASPPTPHDFRRTVATGLAALGVSREDRLAVLAHAYDDVHSRHYDQYDRLDEKRHALTLWADNVASIIASAPPAENVVKLGRRK